MKEQRVRFAPSPTGPLHIGGVRTALYNYLFARKNEGTFILRIEDTDQARYVEGAEAYIIESLKWLDISPDEGPGVGGDFGPYRQSERKDIYKQYIDQLIEKGHAYYAFDTPEEIEAMRARLKESNAIMAQYNSISRKNMKNSLTLSVEEVSKRLKNGDPYVIRVKVPELTEIRFKDRIRGWIHVQSSTIDDKVLMKSDGMPTYHLANVVDDYLMHVTTVIRGEEWLPSAPLHILLYQLFGWEDRMPEFAHLPLILKPEGNGKLSKRDGEKHGFPVFPISWEIKGDAPKVSGFRERGYLPEATLNFLALLGWNPGNEEEIFSLPELEKIFTLERVNKAGAKFDIEKANWINQQYVKRMPASELASSLIISLGDHYNQYDPHYVEMVADAFRERITFPTELYNIARYFFERPMTYDEKVVKKKWSAEIADILGEFRNSLLEYKGQFSKEIAFELLGAILERKGMPMGKVMQPLRVAVTGESGGIDLMQTISMLGPVETGERITIATSRFKEFE